MWRIPMWARVKVFMLPVSARATACTDSIQVRALLYGAVIPAMVPGFLAIITPPVQGFMATIPVRLATRGTSPTR